ncbi:hypothetical protein SESBI_42675 [Sesbania bispinosa]|nr:hypothetical protein SESBI_42675 [Sesbania bispinosa]
MTSTREKCVTTLLKLYGIIKATKRLEKAYLPPGKTLCLAFGRFVDAYRMECPATINRLVVSGVPAMMEHQATAVAAASTLAAIVVEFPGSAVYNEVHDPISMVASTTIFITDSSHHNDIALFYDQIKSKPCTQLSVATQSGTGGVGFSLMDYTKHRIIEPRGIRDAVDLGHHIHCLAEVYSSILKNFIAQSDLLTGIFFSNCMLDMFAKCGSLVDAQILFDELGEREDNRMISNTEPVENVITARNASGSSKEDHPAPPAAPNILMTSRDHDSLFNGGGISFLSGIRNGRFSYGYSSFKGKMSSMEDFFETKISEVDGQMVGFLRVFYGHGGLRTAEYLKIICLRI